MTNHIITGFHIQETASAQTFAILNSVFGNGLNEKRTRQSKNALPVSLTPARRALSCSKHARSSDLIE